MSTMLEMTRASHEDIERLERLILKNLRDNDPQKLSHVRYMIHQIMSITHKLVSFISSSFFIYPSVNRVDRCSNIRSFSLRLFNVLFRSVLR